MTSRPLKTGRDKDWTRPSGEESVGSPWGVIQVVVMPLEGPSSVCVRDESAENETPSRKTTVVIYHSHFLHDSTGFFVLRPLYFVDITSLFSFLSSGSFYTHVDSEEYVECL